MENEKKAEGLRQTSDRRGFVKSVGMGAAAIAGAVMVGGRLGVLDKIPGINKTGLIQAAVKAGSITDVDILNFALNLEYLEAEFYTMATTGQTLVQRGFTLTGTGKSGPTLGGKKVNFLSSLASTDKTGHLVAIMNEIAYDDQQHVHLLRGALGADAVAKPTINLDALGTGFEGFQHATALARAFEDTGVSAYGGAAPLISSKEYLGVAAQIALTEAYHAGNLRLVSAVNHDTFIFQTDKNDRTPPPVGKDYFDVDAQALAVVRDPGQVLAIVYGNSTPGASSGGFFPDGVNGIINSVTS
jgi:hypothetical protein